MAKIRKNSDVVRTVTGVVAIAATLALGACASDDAAEAAPTETAAAPEPAPAPAPSAFGAPAPRFAIPSAAAQSPPSVNTVPTEAPTPRSTEEEREEARRGLVADLTNARHSEFGGRTQPVVVRPYVATAGDQPAPPTAAETPPDAPITNRLDEPPPPRPVEADGAPAKPAAGPAPANKIPTGSR
ncbi:MAG: hypothetical protein AB7E79_14230 [Rhodospirillaceae bacterium]